MKTRFTLCCSYFCLLAGVISNARGADIRQGLIAYWQMEGTDGVITPDATPFANNLNVVGITDANFVSGQFGNAVSLTGSGTYMTNLHSPDPSISGLPIYKAGSYTITMWVKGAAQTAKYLYSEGSTTSNNPLLILQTGQAAANNAKFDVIIRNDTGGALVNHIVSSTVVFDNNWHHIAWVDDRGSVKLYVDGNLDAANFNYVPAGTFTMNTTAVGTLIRAAISTGAIFNGLIDDVAVWKRALSAAEVQEVKTSSLMTPIPTFPAMIVNQPIGSTNYIGDRVTLTGSGDGSPPLSYQWLKNDVEIPGATAGSLTLSGLVENDSGNYTLRVTNRFGTNISNPAILLVQPDPTPNLPSGIISYWPMDEQVEDDFARPTFADIYGHNDFKVVANNLFLDQVPSLDGNAAVFNGIEQYCYREGGFPVYGLPDFSIAMWVNATGTGQSDRRFFAESSTNNNNPVFSLGTHSAGLDGTLRVFIRSDSGTVLLDRNSTRTVFDGTWHHIVWTDTKGQGRLYVDGVLDEASFNYTRGTLSLNATTIGALLRGDGGTNFFNGILDEIGTWSRRISFAEIAQLPNGTVPPPTQDNPPSITLNPASKSLFTRATTTFSVAASGAGPLFVQWRKGGADLPGQTNATLVLSNLTLADAGNFDAVITNAVGSATSQVATLMVTLRPVATELRIDFNNLAQETPLETEAGFSSMALETAVGPGPVTRAFGGAEVTLTAVGGINMQSRKRAAPVNTGAFTEEKLLQDFIFAGDSALGQGMDISIAFLQPNQSYVLTIWSYDNGSAGNRISDWSVNGVMLTNGYTFNGSTLPTDNSTYRFSFPVVADAQGTVLIQGRRSSAATVPFNVFINALTIAPAPEVRIRSIERVAPSSLRLTVDVANPAISHRVEQKSSLESPDWSTVPDAQFDPPNGNTLQVTFGVPDTNIRFYRVVEGP